MSEHTQGDAARTKDPISAVLLIDGDNDPHLPPDFPLTKDTLVRVFLRPGATVPKALERKLSPIPMRLPVLSGEGGRNAADFVMALHSGLLHSTLPMHIPFTLVTADKKLGAIVEELQRIGRQAVLWTSHPERRERRASAEPKAKPARASRGRRRGKPADPPAVSELAKAAHAYGARLARIKDPPSRLKSLINDIASRADLSSGCRPEELIEELKRSGLVSVDGRGRVRLVRPSR
ncbi:MAG: hypothetical protein ABII00_16415 [Elusimicrobiota bacterium]